MRYFIFSFFLFAFGKMTAQNKTMLTPFEKDNSTTATYEEAIDFYQKLSSENNDRMQLVEWGMTDAGFPLHVAVISQNGDFDADALREQNKTILFINNGIHPGEPEGVDATMMFCRDILRSEKESEKLKHVVLVVIPMYNIGGGLNRNSHSRANQNGPVEYGFRGNAKNLDLNRDFIKCDSKNAQTFSQIFNYWQPDVFIDNHTSNGADYTYTMTLLTTQEDKLGPVLGGYLREKMLPKIYADMAAANWEMCPYVNVWGSTPDKGIPGFNDSPRYGSGFGAVHHTISFVPETHMLKPYPDRLKSTYALMQVIFDFTVNNAEEIRLKRAEAKAEYTNMTTVPIDWKIDKTKSDKFLFKGYEGKMKASEVTGLDRLWYDRSAPFEKEIDYWNHFIPTVTVEKPKAYLIPRAYSDVVERLRWNGVEVTELKSDIVAEVEMYYIRDFESRSAYEGHYLHYNTEVEKVTQRWECQKGDYMVSTDQPKARFIMETLEPQAPDSYFSWNFFDGILGQKEGFSPYVFEDIAAEFLKKNPDVKAELEKKRAEDPDFAKSQWAQLFFVYKHTPHYEPTHQLYPVARILR